MTSTQAANASQTAEEAVRKIIEDIEASVYMGSMFLCLSAPQRERLRKRWIKLIEGDEVEHDWANY
jgi:hypothetical protein